MSASIGPRGASFTIGPRGTYANISLPGTGISYRQRLDGKLAKPKASSAQRRPEETAYEEGLLGLLAGRVREPIDWEERAQERRGRGMALRVLSGDRKVWGDVLQSELADEGIPFPCHFDLTVDERSGRIRIVVELPDETVVPDRAARSRRDGSTSLRKLPQKIVRAFYEDICSALVLRLVYETYRVLPDADVVEVVGWRPAPNDPTRRVVFLEITCGRWSFSRPDLDEADPSDLLESLGGLSGLASDPLVPLGILNEAPPEAHTAPAGPQETTGSDEESPTGFPLGAAVVLGSNAGKEELKGLQAELSEQEAALLQKEVELATLSGETHAFHLRYMELVGSRYAKLDQLNARIAEIVARLHPEDHQAQADADAARRTAEESEQASAQAEREIRTRLPKFVASETLKKLFREVAKRIHPDLATDPAEREARTARMAEANRAYQAGDEARLRQILEEWDLLKEDRSAGGIITERNRLVQAIRNVRKRIRVLDEELASLRASEVYSLMITVAEDEARGGNPLADLAGEAYF